MAPVLPFSDSFQLPRCYLATAAATCKERGPDGRPVNELGTAIVPDWISYVFNPNIQSKPSCGNKVPELSSRKFYFDISKNIKKFYRGVYSSNRESR
jgi:hypothetical protein